MGRRRRYTPAEFVELSNDVDELLELLSQTESLNVLAENELKLRRAERAVIKHKLKKVRDDGASLLVSDHAVVRYLERVVGVDVEACKKEIISKLPKDYKPDKAVELVDINDKLRYVIRDKLIISVTPREPAKPRKKLKE